MDHRKTEKQQMYPGGRSLLPACGLMAWALVGCTSLQAQDAEMADADSGNTVEIKVYFEGDCPRYVDNALAEMAQGSAKKLKWVAYDASTGDPKTDAEYSVYFDPFKGKTDDSNSGGVVKSKPLDPDIPANVLFKYTILGTADGLPASCGPLDPFFRIQ